MNVNNWTLYYRSRQKTVSGSVKILICFFLTLLFLGQIPVFAQSPSYISTNGRYFYANNQKKIFTGVNAGLLTWSGQSPPYYIGCGTAFTDTDVNNYLSAAAQNGISLIRVWAMQTYTAGGTNFSRLDNLLTQARQYNIKILLVLENQWSDCTQGGYKYSSWYTDGYKTPYGNYILSLTDYIKKIVPRYANDDTVFGWEIMNEAESKNTDNTENPDALFAFMKTTSELIRSLDSHHIITPGLRNNNEPGVKQDNFIRIHTLSSIDFIDVHTYSPPADTKPTDIQLNLAWAAQINKPILMGEIGIESNCSGCVTPQQRATYMKAKLEQFYADGGAGALLWIYSNDPPQGYSFNATDPLLPLIATFSQEKLIGDANGDHAVNGTDYIIWLVHYGQNTPNKQIDGDFDDNGLVDGRDYILWINHYGLN